MRSSGSCRPNHSGEKSGELSCGSMMSSVLPPKVEASMVKSQYGTVSFGLTTWRLNSNVFVIIEWLVKNPRPSWNCSRITGARGGGTRRRGTASEVKRGKTTCKARQGKV